MRRIDYKAFPNTTSASSLGQKIEAVRKSKRLSQVKLAEILGVSRASISLYETDSGRPSYKVLEKLAEVLGVPIIELSGYNHKGDDTLNETIEQIISRSNDESITTLIRGPFGRQELYVEVAFLGKPMANYDAAPKNVKFNQTDEGVNQSLVKEKYIQWPSISVLAIDGIEYSDARVYVVEDNKLGPRYPKGSRHILHPLLNRDSWQYLTGLHGFSIAGQTTIIRRITANNPDGMVLTDAADNKMLVAINNIEMIWKVGQTTHMPPED